MKSTDTVSGVGTVIDAISIYLYLDRELYFTALLFAVYSVIIFFGWATWLRRYRSQTA